MKHDLMVEPGRLTSSEPESTINSLTNWTFNEEMNDF